MTIRGKHTVCSDVVVTTDAVTNVTIASVDLATLGWDNCAVQIIAMYTGRGPAGESCRVNTMRAFRRVSGVLTLEGSQVNMAAIGGNALLITANSSFAVSGSVLQARVQGVAATTISWVCWMDLYVNGA